MPADIDDDVLLLEGNELDEYLRNIDDNGWNIDSLVARPGGG